MSDRATSQKSITETRIKLDTNGKLLTSPYTVILHIKPIGLEEREREGERKRKREREREGERGAFTLAFPLGALRQGKQKVPGNKTTNPI